MIPVAAQSMSLSHASRPSCDMLGECQARPAACDAALASPERRTKDCRHWETAFERPGARRNVRVPQSKHLRGRPGVRGLRRHRPGPGGRAQSPDGRAHRLSGSPELSTPARDLVVRGFRPMRTQLYRGLWSVRFLEVLNRGLFDEIPYVFGNGKSMLR